jgi:hypothetical protein
MELFKEFHRVIPGDLDLSVVQTTFSISDDPWFLSLVLGNWITF